MIVAGPVFRGSRKKGRMIYTDLDVWKEARILVKLVYTSIVNFPKDEIFALQSQIKRAAISIPSNIAEGSGRNHGKDSLQFFSSHEARHTN